MNTFKIVHGVLKNSENNCNKFMAYISSKFIEIKLNKKRFSCDDIFYKINQMGIS